MILPGVTIGDDVVIGAGSVVSKDIPDHMVAAGNPCKIIREITEEDKEYYYKKRKFDIKIDDWLNRGCICRKMCRCNPYFR